MDLCETLGEVPAGVLWSAWQRWIGPERFHRKLDQMSRAGWTEWRGTAYNLDRVIRLTTSGRLAASGGRDPQARWSRHWDRRWRLVLFDIPEHARAVRLRLRRKLHVLGFGYLQDSVWISPDSLSEVRDTICAAKADVETFTVMEARPCASDRDRDPDGELVKGAWKFDQINRNYELYEEILEAGPRFWDSSHARRRWFDAECRAWEKAFRSDPLLPEDLLPASYRGKQAWAHRQKRLREILR